MVVCVLPLFWASSAIASTSCLRASFELLLVSIWVCMLYLYFIFSGYACVCHIFGAVLVLIIQKTCISWLLYHSVPLCTWCSPLMILYLVIIPQSSFSLCCCLLLFWYVLKTNLLFWSEIIKKSRARARVGCARLGGKESLVSTGTSCHTGWGFWDISPVGNTVLVEWGWWRVSWHTVLYRMKWYRTTGWGCWDISPVGKFAKFNHLQDPP